MVINSAQKKIFKVNQDGTQTDFVAEVSPLFDTYLRAKTGKSTININTNDSAEGFKLTGSWRQYTLWLFLFMIKILKVYKTMQV